MNLLWALGIALTTYTVALYLGRTLRHRQLLKQTCVLDIDSLGLRLPREKMKGTAVICGGSIGGLLAARICHDHFDKVVIVEPEAWMNSEDAIRVDAWNQESKRSRIMQYESLHVVLAMGYKVMQKLFTDIEEKCYASSIKVGPNDTHARMWGNVPRLPYAEYGGSLPKTFCAGRAGFETFLRRLVLGGDYKHIRQVIDTVTGVSQSAHNPGYLDGISVRTPEGIQNISATLVVDCTGPAAAGLKWLRREGYGFVDTYTKNQLPLDQLRIAYDQKLQYSTLKFHVPPELGRKIPGLSLPYDECGYIYCLSTDPDKDHRNVYSQRIDGNFIQLCFSTMGEYELPKTLEEGKAFVRSLITEKPIPETFFVMLDMLDEVTDTMTYSHVRYPGSSYIRYEKAVNLPSNWVLWVIVQGCSKAFFGAVCLNKLLMNSTAIPKDFSKKYFSDHAEKIKPLCRSKPVIIPSRRQLPLPGETLSHGSWIRWYMKKLVVLSFTDEQAGSAVWHVRTLLAPSIDAFQLGLVLKVFWSLIKGTSGNSCGSRMNLVFNFDAVGFKPYILSGATYSNLYAGNPN
ncbi:uncharacterized protein EV420DRAFT_1474205 [Desarmillaria tabescens]|uniref:FAD/NAD(P)-binding domain-containing protein n=1 Tax=Armillaria tabescens TaxID=1929756 RepID=A0AA39TYH8_ARMTA|nr:uncharacterized protein EV420DRAFT_1474205 [Desarmillaria tabescens]KAK0466769.1 hypothetical protein EV420DRAFT_1474205 [Desarmillaria tabescens]